MQAKKIAVVLSACLAIVVALLLIRAHLADEKSAPPGKKASPTGDPSTRPTVPTPPGSEDKDGVQDDAIELARSMLRKRDAGHHRLYVNAVERLLRQMKEALDQRNDHKFFGFLGPLELLTNQCIHPVNKDGGKCLTQWQSWWKENRSKTYIETLLASLVSPTAACDIGWEDHVFPMFKMGLQNCIFTAEEIAFVRGGLGDVKSLKRGKLLAEALNTHKQRCLRPGPGVTSPSPGRGPTRPPPSQRP